ncbi:hypothetical protein T265_15891, partial [Opisthorchis viverrini]
CASRKSTFVWMHQTEQTPAGPVSIAISHHYRTVSKVSLRPEFLCTVSAMWKSTCATMRKIFLIQNRMQ